MNMPEALSPLNTFADSTHGSALTTTIHDDGDVVVLEVGGEVDILSEPLLRDAVTKSLHDRPRVLLLDLLAVRFFGSAGLALLLETQQLAGEQTLLRVVADGPTVRRPLHVTGLDQQFALYPTRETALRDA